MPSLPTSRPAGKTRPAVTAGQSVVALGWGDTGSGAPTVLQEVSAGEEVRAGVHDGRACSSPTAVSL